jgi:hypothetical protein
VLSYRYFVSKIWDLACKLFTVLENNLASCMRNANEFFGYTGARMSKLHLYSIHLAEIMAIDEYLHASSLSHSLTFLGLFLDLLESFLLSLLDLFSRQVVRVLLNRLLSFPQFFSLSLVGNLSPKACGKGNALDLVVVVFEFSGWDPFLVIES